MRVCRHAVVITESDDYVEPATIATAVMLTQMEWVQSHPCYASQGTRDRDPCRLIGGCMPCTAHEVLG